MPIYRKHKKAPIKGLDASKLTSLQLSGRGNRQIGI
jgi:hypothetical protein